MSLDEKYIEFELTVKIKKSLMKEQRFNSLGLTKFLAKSLDEEIYKLFNSDEMVESNVSKVFPLDEVKITYNVINPSILTYE